MRATQIDEGKSPLDTTFGPHSSRAQALKTKAQGGILEISESALTHLMLSTVSKLARVAERHPDALKFFPEGSRLSLSATGESGSYCEDGYLNMYCELKYPDSNGKIKSSGREQIYSLGSKDSIEVAFERFLRSLESGELEGKGGAK